MADFDHLPLVRLPRIQRHRKTQNMPPPPARDRRVHADKVAAEVTLVLAAEARRQKVAGIDPNLVLRVEMADQTAEDEWRRAGFQVLAQDSKKLLILFTSDVELAEFRSRLESFRDDPLTEKGNAPHNGLFANIEHVSALTPEDRVGPRLRRGGVATVAEIAGRSRWIVDIEVWDAESPIQREVRAQKLIEFVAAQKGHVLSQYIGLMGLIVFRAKVTGSLLRRLCDVAEIAIIDLPPKPDLEHAPLSNITVTNVGSVTAPPPGAPVIGIIDSGISANPILVQATLDSFGAPTSLGGADIAGHGTQVAGIAIYGDITERIETRSFSAPFWLLSVRVVNKQGRFDDIQTIVPQMEQAIRGLQSRGCRIINISLGDAQKVPYSGGRVSAWAESLDILARALDVLIIVSAGNSRGGDQAPWGGRSGSCCNRVSRISIWSRQSDYRSSGGCLRTNDRQSGAWQRPTSG